MSRIEINNSLLIQSPFLFCQAAGSDGSDNTVPGNHLRWDMLKELGYRHIPKGNLFDFGVCGNCDVWFNKKNDFVSLFRTEYRNGAYKKIINIREASRLGTISPLPMGGAGFMFSPLFDGPQFDTMLVRFLDEAKYYAIISVGLVPDDPIQDFLNKYDGIIEIEALNKMMFRFELGFGKTKPTGGSAGVKTECVSGKDWIYTAAPHSTVDYRSLLLSEVIRRDYFQVSGLSGTSINLTGENIAYVRLQQLGMPVPDFLTIETYEDFFAGTQINEGWDKIGDFSLSLDDMEVFTRFQGDQYAGGNLQLNWPKYNDGDILNPDNYSDRWLTPVEGLKDTLQKYLDLSIFDPRANVFLQTDPNDPNGITVSMLDMLRIVALDYHGARMMGLGYLDKDTVNNPDQQFIYAAVYTTYRELSPFGVNTDHVFLTVPTSVNEKRLPVPPQLNDITYGLYVNTNDDGNEPVLISDPQGYSFYDDVRYVNLDKVNQIAPQEVKPFIPPNDAFDTTVITQPSTFGIEYRKKGITNWVKPEILHDDEYNDSNGVPETNLTPEHDGIPFYTHQETNNGVHEYALYSVNWFSRPSGISNIKRTNETKFVKKNTLLPPFNVAVQYIQEEDPLIFTTQKEQDDLAAANLANPSGDNCRTRVMFDWDNIHNNAYQSADTVEFFYREIPVKKVEGKIKSVSSISVTESLVVTTSYLMASLNPPVTIMPVITPGDEPKFIGSLLNTAEGQFMITSVAQPTVSSDGPSFTVKKIASQHAFQPDPDEPIVMVTEYQEPVPEVVFFVIENLSDPVQWTKLSKALNLVSFSNRTETIFEEDGSSHVEVTGGIYGNASITDIFYNGTETGGYTIEFNPGTGLSNHPDPDVDWVKGIVRCTLNADANKKKRLAVVSILQRNPVKLVVYDAEYLTEPLRRIKTGVNLEVNFHPSYKIYLKAEPGKFDRVRIMPAGNANNKKTYLAARSADTTIPNYSTITSPGILLARNIKKPVVPEAILSPTFATRPDFYGKSTYTMDVKLNINGRVPYGLVIYKANEMSVLHVLYKPATLRQVVADLAAISDNDPYNFNRWQSLVHVETDPADNNSFKLFGTYRFPNPDNDSTENFLDAVHVVKPFPFPPGITLQSQTSVVKKIIEDIFSPVTELPIVFEYLKKGYQTSPKKPKYRDIVDRLLSPADPEFDPYPMAVKFPQTNPDTVRFTDYTLDGNARNIYFYFAREIAVDTKLSERTPIAGPVVLVDAAPAEVPKIRKIISSEADHVLNKPASVLFELADYIHSENIKKYQIFRTTNFAETASTRTMQLAATIASGQALQDSFPDLAFPPYGQPLYYRIAALREIVNEKGDTEYIPSKPSEVVLTNIIDVYNPEAPAITAVIGSTQTNSNGTTTAFLNVSLTWNKSVDNGTYTLFKMNNKGNWEKIWSKKTNDLQIIFPENGNFILYPQTANLPKLDENGNEIYHRFKVSVENASGLFNLEDNEFTL